MIMRVAMFVTLIAMVMLTWSGCTGYGQYMVSSGKYSPTKAADIHVYTVYKSLGRYETLGYLSVYSSDARDAGDELKARLRESAALIGADAIVAFKLNQDSGGGGGVEGIAVKFTK